MWAGGDAIHDVMIMQIIHDFAYKVFMLLHVVVVEVAVCVVTVVDGATQPYNPSPTTTWHSPSTASHMDVQSFIDPQHCSVGLFVGSGVTASR